MSIQSILLLFLLFYVTVIPSEADVFANDDELVIAVKTFEKVEGNSDDLISSFRSIGSVNSLLIQINGEVIVEEYFDGMNGNRTTNIKSASKSLLSLLIGIAIDHGYLEGVDQKIELFFPEYFESDNDSIKTSITIKDLLSMRSGLETTSFHNYGRWVTSQNWVRFTLNQPLEDEPGGKMIYSTGSSHLLSVILTKAAGINVRFLNGWKRM